MHPVLDDFPSGTLTKYSRGLLSPTAESGYPGWGSSITGSPVTCPQNLASAGGSAQSNVMLQMVDVTAFLHVVSGARRQVPVVGGRRGNQV
jgi:hypothetical protein